MQKDERDLLEVLKSELEFLTHGEYGRSPKSPWRPQYIFEDSFTCMNCNSPKNPRSCNDCVLMQLVPGERRSEKIPCRYIPLNKSGETLDSLYRSCDQEEIEETVRKWLQATIRQLEEGRQAVRENHNKQPGPGGLPPSGIALYEQQHPKCANPACPTAFYRTGGGRFFRFRPDPVSSNGDDSTADKPAGIPGVRHYWLCERCSHVFTLAYEEGSRVALKVLWPELAAGEPYKGLSAD